MKSQAIGGTLSLGSGRSPLVQKKLKRCTGGNREQKKTSFPLGFTLNDWNLQKRISWGGARKRKSQNWRVRKRKSDGWPRELGNCDKRITKLNGQSRGGVGSGISHPDTGQST